MLKKPCTWEFVIIKIEEKTPAFPEFIDFKMPFGGKLRADNRWILLSKIIPWDFVQEKYHKKFKSMKIGAPAKKARIAFGALIIKEQMKFTDEELVEQIKENPYLQYLLGYEEYSDKKPFCPSLMVYFRKRISREDIAKINETTIETHKEKDDEDDNSDPPTNKGKLIVDATCAPADIKYPTDLNLINEAREKSEKIIDILHEPLKGKEKKVRTYRRGARQRYLSVAKSKKPGKKLRKMIGIQLRYLRRNLGHIDKLIEKNGLFLLNRREYRNLLVIHEVYRQQFLMYSQKCQRIPHRIVSISQPYVRPIVRGKVGKSTEFGPKISISLIEGFTYLDRICWDNYNESVDLIEQIERYKSRFGFYPEVVLADQIYRNKKNRAYCKERGIKMCGPPLGRKPKVKVVEKYRESERNPVEGKFGEAKRRYSLGLIMTKLPKTSESKIAMIIFVMNLRKILRDFSVSFFYDLLFAWKMAKNIQFN